MTWLIWWIRSWFCAHSFQLDETNFRYIHKNEFGRQVGFEKGIKVSATCKRCGWHRTYNKFKL